MAKNTAYKAAQISARCFLPSAISVQGTEVRISGRINDPRALEMGLGPLSRC